MNLTEIEKRMVELRDEISKEDADLNAIETEINQLKEEKRALIEAAEKREKMLADAKEFGKPLHTEKKEERKEMEKLNIASKEYRDLFFAHLMGKELKPEERAVVTATAAIPTETFNKIVAKMEHVAPIIKKVTVSQLPSYVNLAVENANADAAWVAMGTAATDSSDSLSNVSLSAYKLIKTIEVGADVDRMSVDAFEEFIVNALYRKMAKAVENAIINGTGSGQPTGLALAGQITQTGTYTKAAMTYADLLKIVGDLPDHGYRANASFVMPSALFYSDVLPALTDKGSGLDVQAVEKLKVFSYDVILCDRMPTDTIIFGDLSYFHFNWAAPVEIKADASVGFRNGSVVYRALALADGKPTLAAAFNKYTRSAT